MGTLTTIYLMVVISSAAVGGLRMFAKRSTYQLQKAWSRTPRVFNPNETLMQSLVIIGSDTLEVSKSIADVVGATASGAITTGVIVATLPLSLPVYLLLQNS